MKKVTLLLTITLLIGTSSFAQLFLQNGTTNYVIDFDNTYQGVNSGSFAAAGFASSPTSGQLDAEAWATTGLSDGSKNFGAANTTGDHARGTSSGGVGTGGIYGFDVGSGNRALGIQPTGSDWTPGTLTLKIVNSSTSVINDMTIDYTLYVRNDQGRASSFNFSYSLNNSSFTDAVAGNYTSEQTAGSTAWVANAKQILLSNLNLNPGADFYIRWAGSDVSGSGSRDEFALDDISITATGSSNSCTEPTAQASNLNFGTITSNSIQANFNTAAADKYLVVHSTNSSLGATPNDGTIYSSGDFIGNGEVLQFSNATNINALGLLSDTPYYFYVFAANDNCSGGPDYLTTNPLSGSVSTTSNGNSNYYNSIGNETCSNLKTALSNLIDDHTSVSYGSLWTHYQTTDDHLNDSGNENIVWDMYSDNPVGSENEFSFVSEQCGTYQSEGDCYNREHSFPKSWWGGSTSVPQYTDLFTVVPVDGWINGVRNNNPYGEIQNGTETQITDNGTALGSSSISIPGYSGSVFEPINAYKGDLARGYFYMATRYESSIAGWENTTTEADAVLDGTTYPVYEPWMISMLLDWHNNDPVDQKEIDRNESIYSIQGNRNPFIDHPEYAAAIWGNCNGGGDVLAPTNPSALSANNILPNSTNLSWSASTDNVGVAGYKIFQNGVQVQTSNGLGTSTTISGLNSNATYAFYVTAFDAAGNESNASNSINVTTPFVDTQAPTAPSALNANNIAETSANLSWSGATDNVGVSGYFIYQDGLEVNTTTSTSLQITGLTEGQTYSFYVTAYDEAGNESSASNSISVTTLTTAQATILHDVYFETGWDGWQDGGSDCYRYAGFRSPEGNYSIRIRDNSGTSSAMTSPAFNISNYSTIDIEFSFYANSMENNEDFWLRYYDGNTWQTIATYVRGQDFSNGSVYNQTVSIDAGSYNFPSNARFRFQNDASGNNDRIYIDEVKITADAPVSPMIVIDGPMLEVIEKPSETIILEIDGMQNEIDLSDSNDQQGSQVFIFPNPATDFLQIDLGNAYSEISKIDIYDALGRACQNISTDFSQQSIQLDISNWTSGLYFFKPIDWRK